MFRKISHTAVYSWVLALALLPGCFWDKNKETPAQEEQPTVMALKEGLFVVNVTDKNQYDDCHIKNSIRVNLDELHDFANTLDKEKTDLVFYCSNYRCSASGMAAQKFIKLGFKNVAAYEGGITEWYQKGLPVEGPAQEPYLKKENKAIPHEDAMIPVIDADTLAEKMGLSLPA